MVVARDPVPIEIPGLGIPLEQAVKKALLRGIDWIQNICCVICFTCLAYMVVCLGWQLITKESDLTSFLIRHTIGTYVIVVALVVWIMAGPDE